MSKTVTTSTVPSESRLDRIAKRAHELYEGRRGSHGADLADWLQAEREVDAADSATPPETRTTPT